MQPGPQPFDFYGKILGSFVQSKVGWKSGVPMKREGGRVDSSSFT